ncbi:MAG: PP2C family protein-serine/threonine phosphatase [Planctomycetota bacterium]
MHVLLVEPSHAATPVGAGQLAAEFGWSVKTATSYRAAFDCAKDTVYDVIVLPTPDGQNDQLDADFRRLWELVDSRPSAALLLGQPNELITSNGPSIVEVVNPEAPIAEIRGRFAMIERYHERFAQMDGEVRRMERLGKRLNEHFREVDQEMQLAARLQRDFLPRNEGPIENLEYAAVYRPATWVSGDIYDVFRIDEDHTGIYVADAVGHGVAASLLTMFIKRSINAKRVEGSSYTVLSPSETMAILNDALAEQGLPNCQFVTACYAVFNHRTLVLEYARGGHPYPVMIGKDGVFQELRTTGGLLGLFGGEEFSSGQIQLHPGDKILIYTDGVELAFQNVADGQLDTSAYFQSFRNAAHLPVQDMLDKLQNELNHEPGSLNPRDDITLLGLEIL